MLSAEVKGRVGRQRREKERVAREKVQMSTWGYKGRADSDSPTRPNEVVRVTTLYY